MFAAEHIHYQQTGAFSKIVTDYLDGHPDLEGFYASPPTPEGLRSALERRKSQAVDRDTLVQVLRQQYEKRETSEAVRKNIEALGGEDSFTITTAHQPNLFSGPLYFLYKILHAIRLANELHRHHPQQSFIPVYYMGSEDADFEELNHFHVRGKRYEWKTRQTGAVGRMEVDASLIQLLAELEQQLGVEPQGDEVCRLLRACYAPGKTIQQATFELVDQLFSAYGLVVLIPDHPLLKRQMKRVFEDDLFHHRPAPVVEATSERLAQSYGAQAFPREINLFYLEGPVRERIVRKGRQFLVHDTDISFSEEELRQVWEEHPERFSPNVILRGLFQETILPNLAFVGGGGELAYWLQLKDLFDHYGIPFPVLVLRNSFLLIEKPQQELAARLRLSHPDLFRPNLELLDRQIEREGQRPTLNGEAKELREIYEALTERAAAVDPTLRQHVEALKVKTLHLLQNLEKKMLRAERRKHEDSRRQIEKLKRQLFPGNGLQERVENFSGYYALWGPELIQALYEASPALEQQFTILTRK